MLSPLHLNFAPWDLIPQVKAFAAAKKNKPHCPTPAAVKTLQLNHDRVLWVDFLIDSFNPSEKNSHVSYVTVP